MTEKVKMENLFWNIAAFSDNDDEPQGPVEMDSTEEHIAGLETKFKHLAVARARLERRVWIFGAWRKANFDYQLNLRLKKQQKLRQTTTSHFETNQRLALSVSLSAFPQLRA